MAPSASVSEAPVWSPKILRTRRRTVRYAENDGDVEEEEEEAAQGTEVAEDATTKSMKGMEQKKRGSGTEILVACPVAIRVSEQEPRERMDSPELDPKVLAETNSARATPEKIVPEQQPTETKRAEGAQGQPKDLPHTGACEAEPWTGACEAEPSAAEHWPCDMKTRSDDIAATTSPAGAENVKNVGEAAQKVDLPPAKKNASKPKRNKRKMPESVSAEVRLKLEQSCACMLLR